MPFPVEISHLEKKFGDVVALKNISLRVERGECLGLLGPNGAGKSTLIQILYGALNATSGTVSVLGMNPKVAARQIKKRIGVVTQDNALDESLTVKENMLLYASFQGINAQEAISRVNTLLEFMNLTAKSNSPIQTLSGGMKRRLVFVRALLNHPELLILDEPTTGLDPAMRHLLWQKVKEVKGNGTTCLLTTHYMHEAEILCDRIAIFHAGKLLEVGTPKALIQKYSPGYVAVFDSREGESLATLRADSMIELVDLVKSQPTEPLQMRPSNLEDVFLKLTGQELSRNE